MKRFRFNWNLRTLMLRVNDMYEWIRSNATSRLRVNAFTHNPDCLRQTPHPLGQIKQPCARIFEINKVPIPRICVFLLVNPDVVRRLKRMNDNEAFFMYT